MSYLSLPTRIVLGIAGVIAALIIAFIGYYLYLSSSRGKPIARNAMCVAAPLPTIAP